MSKPLIAQTPDAGQQSLGLREKRELYWPQIEAAIRAAGLRVQIDEGGRRIVYAECEKCTCLLSLLDRRESRRMGSRPTGLLRLQVRHQDWHNKFFPELKKGGLNLLKLVDFLKSELTEEHARHLRQIDREANKTSAFDALRGAVTSLGLPDLWDRNYRDELDGDYGGGFAKPKENGMIQLSFDVAPVEVETVLEFLKEQGVLEREAF